MLIGSLLCSVYCNHSLIGCPRGEEVKELKALLVFAPEQVLQEWIWHVHIRLIQFRRILLVIGDFKLLTNAKL